MDPVAFILIEIVGLIVGLVLGGPYIRLTRDRRAELAYRKIVGR